MNRSFTFSGISPLSFGLNALDQLAELILPFGRRILLITGKNSLQESGHWDRLMSQLHDQKIIPCHESQSGEPSPDDIDSLAARYRDASMEALVSIGGGSVLDCGKAVAAMLPVPGSIAGIVSFHKGISLDRYAGPGGNQATGRTPDQRLRQ